MGPWGTSRAALSLAGAACLAAGILVCAGCTSGRASSPATSPAATSTHLGGSATTAPALPTRALGTPACSTATATSAVLSSVKTAMLSTDGTPFGVAVAPDGDYGFAAVTGTGGSHIDVLRMARSAAGAPVMVRSIQVAGQPLGETVTRNGKYLLAADGNGAVVISVARAESGAADAVLGTLAAPGGTGQTGVAGSAIEVATSADGRYAFVTLEYDQRAAVFNLADALSRGFGGADYVGSIPLGQAAVGMAVSPDGRWLYATSEGEVPAQHPVGIISPAVRAGPTLPAAQAARAGIMPGEPPGTLSLIDVRRAETDPAHSVVATVYAGCQPVRVVTAANGTQVWVSARASDDVLCFAADRLASDPSHALVAVVRVGEAPVGLTTARGGALIVVADSNRFAAAGANSDLSVINVGDALSGRPAIVGQIPAGLFPRDMTTAPNGAVLVSNFSSDQVETVDGATIP